MLSTLRTLGRRRGAMRRALRSVVGTPVDAADAWASLSLSEVTDSD
jgi:hypothetical protein